MWIPTKWATYAHALIFFIKYCMIFKSKTLFLVIKEQNPQIFKLFQWCRDFVNSFVISLDWTIDSNLDFVLKSFKCSKGDVWDVFSWQLYEMNPQNCRRKKLGDEATENWQRRYGEWIGMWQEWLVIFVFCSYF